MRSNYKLLGDYIQEVNVRNTDLKDLNLLGISIQKEFIPSIANTIGTDMSKYKIVKKNQFSYGTVTSRNGDKISIALLQSHEEVLISQAYISFEVIDENELLPEYLMMWFRRPEFDRYARYMSYGSAREVFLWEEMCNVKLPIPSIEKQREIVKEYNTILNRIKINQKMISKMDELAKSCYKELVSYMQVNSKEVYQGILSDLVEIKYGKDHNKLDEGDIPVFGSGGIMRYVNKKLYEGESILIPRKGSLDNIMYVNKKFWSVDTMFFTVMKRENIAKYIYYFMKSLDLKGMNSGSAVPSMTTNILNNLPIGIPKKDKLELFEERVEPIFKYIQICEKEIEMLKELKWMLLGKLS